MNKLVLFYIYLSFILFLGELINTLLEIDEISGATIFYPLCLVVLTVLGFISVVYATKNNKQSK